MRTVVRTRENDETYLVRVGDEIGRIIYMPLELGWASTVHKAQGITAFSGIQAFVGGMSTGGTMYVVASRCKRGQDLILIGTPQEFLRNCKAFGKVHRAGYLDLESLRKTI